MSAPFGDAAIVHHQDLIGVLDRGQAMSNGQTGPAPGKVPQGALDHGFAFVVEC